MVGDSQCSSSKYENCVIFEGDYASCDIKDIQFSHWLQGELDVRVLLQPCTFRLLGGELFDIWKQRGQKPRDQTLVFHVT